MHDSFQDFFEYLDAQKLRTPKGLDWIKSRYPTLSQLQLMREMQGLRLMHCTMWTEGVREIVTAEESDVKFIVTDHPVTIYNAALPPTSPECSYPGDPLIELVGSQTVFALDANTCLILTHLENAQEPKASDLTAPRTHARYRGQSLVMTFGDSAARSTLGMRMGQRTTRTHSAGPQMPTSTCSARIVNLILVRTILVAAAAAANSSIAARSCPRLIVHHGMSTAFESAISCSPEPSRTSWG